MAAPSSRTVQPRPGGPWDDLAFPSKDPLDILPSPLDLSLVLADLGLTIAAAPILSADPSLTVAVLSVVGPVITLQVGGGTSGTTPGIGLLVPLSGGNQEVFAVAQPVASRLAPGLVAAPLAANDALPILLAAAF